jgi:hypothetical protein
VVLQQREASQLGDAVGRGGRDVAIDAHRHLHEEERTGFPGTQLSDAEHSLDGEAGLPQALGLGLAGGGVAEVLEGVVDDEKRLLEDHASHQEAGHRVEDRVAHHRARQTREDRRRDDRVRAVLPGIRDDRRTVCFLSSSPMMRRWKR